MSEVRPEVGLFESLKRMMATLLELAHVRLELISVEIEDQIAYAAGVILWGIAAIFFGSLTVLLLAFTIVIAFWDDHRLLAAALVTAAFAAFAVTAIVVVRARLRSRPRFLAATSEEFKRDAQALEDAPP
jgi:uncharacterized membrane protein YqjE